MPRRDAAGPRPAPRTAPGAAGPRHGRRRSCRRRSWSAARPRARARPWPHRRPRRAAGSRRRCARCGRGPAARSRRSTESSGLRSVATGFTAARTTTGAPLDMPPSMPPARFVRRRPAGAPGIDLVVHLAARGAIDAEAEPDLDALDGLDAHDRRRQRGVEARCPTRRSSRARWARLRRRRRSCRRSNRRPRSPGRPRRACAPRPPGRGSAAGWDPRGRARASRRGCAPAGSSAPSNARHGPSWSTKLQIRTPATASSWRQTAPAATRGAVDRAEARSRTSRMSAVSYLMAPARSAWPGRARVTGFGRRAMGIGSTDIRSCQFTQSRLRMVKASGEPSVRPNRRPAVHSTRSRSISMRLPLP